MKAWEERAQRVHGLEARTHEHALMNDAVCCIYHKPREAGESSDESSDSSSDDSDSEPDTSRARPANRRSHRHDDDKPCDHGGHQPDSEPKSKGMGKQKERKPSPNAYERLPKKKSK